MRRNVYLCTFLSAAFSFLTCLPTHAANAPSFKIAGPATLTSVKNPGAAGITITATPENGFTGGINFVSCTLIGQPSGAMNLPTCTQAGPVLREPAVTITGTNPGTFSLTVATVGVALPVIQHQTAMLAVNGGAVLACGAFLLLPIRLRLEKKYKTLLMVLFSVLLVNTIVGCGGGTSTTTPQGNYTFTVSCADAASGQVKASGNFTVSVQ